MRNNTAFILVIIVVSGMFLGPSRSQQSTYIANAQREQDLSPKGEYDEIVTHSYYKLSYAEAHEQAEWVMYTLQGSGLNPSIGRTDNFRRAREYVVVALS